MASVYWVGADGNVYVKGPNGVTNQGHATAAFDQGYQTANSFSIGENAPTRIADPAAVKPQVPAGPANPNGGSGSTTVDKSNDIALQNSGLGSVGSYVNSGIASVNKTLGEVNGQYDTDVNDATNSYNTNSGQNNANLQKNKQTALVNAAQGRSGLFATLASLGALNGSGITLATDAVQKGANDDLSGASDNFATNQQALDSSIGTFKNAVDKERKQAQSDADTAIQNVRNTGLTDTQKYYSSLASDYADEGDSANAKKYTGLAAGLFPSIATSTPTTGPTYQQVAYTPASLASYLGSANTSVNVVPSAGGGIPGLVAAPVKKKVLQPA